MDELDKLDDVRTLAGLQALAERLAAPLGITSNQVITILEVKPYGTPDTGAIQVLEKAGKARQDLNLPVPTNIFDITNYAVVRDKVYDSGRDPNTVLSFLKESIQLIQQKQPEQKISGGLVSGFADDMEHYTSYNRVLNTPTLRTVLDRKSQALEISPEKLALLITDDSDLVPPEISDTNLATVIENFVLANA